MARNIDYIHRIPVPNPFFEGRNSVYLIKSDPITLIDTGVATDKAFAQLSEGLANQGLTTADVRRVILTHKHIDHIGSAWRIQRDGGAEVYIHELETRSLVDIDPSGKRFGELVSQRLEKWQAPPAPASPDSTSKMPQWTLEACESPIALQDGDAIETEHGPIAVIHTPGHTMGSVCLKLGDEALFTGDHVLRAISPNVGAGDMRSRGMLTHFLNSLQKVHPLGDEIVLYPGHGSRFDGLATRCDELREHHVERLDKTLAAISHEPKSVYQVALALFGDLADFHIMLGCAEANSHLEYLVDNGRATETDDKFLAASA